MISWITVVWSMIAASCLTLAAVHLLVWSRNRSAHANLLFSVLAISLAVFVAFEVGLMRASSVAVYTKLHQTAHLAMFLVVISIVGFVQSYFRTGRPWLLWTIIGLRVLVLILAYIPGPTFNFREIHSLGAFDFLGETVAMAEGVPSAWARLGEFSAFLALLFVVDASIRLWRRGDARQRQRALVVGGSVGLCIVFALTFSLLFHSGRIQAPYLVSLTFMLIVAAMGYELSRDLIESGRLAADLRESTENMQLAAKAAHLALWRWDIKHDVIWVNPEGRRLYGIPETDAVDHQRFLETLHPDDRVETDGAVQKALDRKGKFEAGYRVIHAEDGIRWIEARGRVDRDADGQAVRMRGVSIDVTERVLAEREAQGLRNDLAHTGRVTLVGQLSSALAHELSQPLGAILRNAEAAELILEDPSPDLDELRAIVRDIHADDQRAGLVIDRLRSLLGHGSVELQPVDLEEVIGEVISLLHTEARSRGIDLKAEIAGPLLNARGDRVQLIQVLLNLVINAMDAVCHADTPRREVKISAAPAGTQQVEIRVRDSGPGISPETFGRLFEPFFTTKPEGMGMGLPVSRTIMEAHKGTLEVEMSAPGDAVFILTLPVSASARS